MTPALIAGMTGWQWAVGLLVRPMIALIGVVVVALILHWMIERWAAGPKGTP